MGRDLITKKEKLYLAAQQFELQNNIDAALDCYRKIVANKTNAGTYPAT